MSVCDSFNKEQLNLNDEKNLMAFANLFTSLAPVDKDRPDQPAFTHRNQSENGKRSNAKKRKPQGEQTGPYNTKRCYQEEKMHTYNAASFVYNDSKSIHCHLQNTASENAGFTFSKEVMHNYSGKTSRSGLFWKGQNFRGKYNNNVNKQHQQRKKTKEPRNQHQLQHRQKNANRSGHHQTRQTSGEGGRDRKYKDGKQVQDLQDKPRRFMTQEFKDQNSVTVDGRLLCRHFICGRCIKGDDCQLEHVQGYNDLLKEVCKFYVQGFCSKGESCPYMHKSFPCKFFHRRGKCYQEADCRFSHEPLNEVTTRILDEAIKRDNDLSELAKKAEQDLSGQAVNAEVSEITDTNTSFDLLIQPLRPNFYNSEETNAEQEVLLCQAEELPNDTEEMYPNQTQPHSPPSAEPIQEEPVCYSVEAVLGRRLFKPFPSFCRTPQVQESTSSSKSTSASVNQSEVPYSVDALLRSCKSVENSTLLHTPTPPVSQTVSYTPKTDCEEVTDALLRSEIQNEDVSCSVSTRNEQTNKSHETIVKSLSSHKVHTDPIPNTHPDLTLVYGSHKKQAVEEPLRPTRRVSREVKLLHYPVTAAEKLSRRDMKASTNITHSVNSKNESDPPVAPSTCKASVKPSCPPAGFSVSKRRAAVSPERVTSFDKAPHSGNSVSRNFIAEQPTEIHQHCKKIRDYCSKLSHGGELSVGCDKTQKRPFHSLFVRPITGSLKPATDSALITHCTSKDINVRTAAEPDKASTRSFLSLFAAPLITAPQSQPGDSRTASCSQESKQAFDSISHLSDSKQRASHLDTALQCQLKIDGKQNSHKSSSPKLSTGPKNEFDALSEHGNHLTEQQRNPACVWPDSLGEMCSSPAPCANSPDPSTSQSHQQQLMSSHKGSAAAASGHSVLKTLFLCLSPYQQDREQHGSIQRPVSSGSEKDKSSRECAFEKRRKSKKKGRQKTMKTQDSHQQCSDKTVAHSTVHQPTFQTPQISSEATGGSSICSPDTPELAHSGRRHLPFKAETPLMQHHTRLMLRHNSEEGKWVHGNTATPLKDLFKTLDTTVFHFGH